MKTLIITLILSVSALSLPVFADGKVCIANRSATLMDVNFDPQIFRKNKNDKDEQLQKFNLAAGQTWCVKFKKGDTEVANPKLNVQGGKNKTCSSFSAYKLANNHQKRTYKVTGSLFRRVGCGSSFSDLHDDH